MGRSARWGGVSTDDCPSESAPPYYAARAIDPPVGRGSLGGDAADLTDRLHELIGLLANPPFRSGHAGDRFLHERAPEVVRAPLKDLLAILHAHLHPRHLDVRDSRVE